MCEEMDMPCPCQKCGEIFDLNDGTASDKWFPNTVICETCGYDESQEIETDNDLEELKQSMDDAIFTLREGNKSLNELLKKRSEMGIVEDPGTGNITKQQLLDNDWVIDESDPMFPISKDLVDRSQLTDDDDPDDHVCSLVYSQGNGSGKFGLLITDGYVIDLAVSSVAELFYLEQLIAGVDAPY